ncbi:MAG TPA: rod shape-determining protein MreC [Bacteroidota bacterium]|mgnify:CR=1 FL=1|nr:rod shape-determining protein MreC [Bacteroidota bacterium]
MIRIFNIFFKFKAYFLLIILIIVSSFLLFQNNNIQIKQIRSNTILAIGYLQENFSDFFNMIWIPHILSIAEENNVLRKQNVILSEELSRLREASLENIRLKKLLEFKQSSKYNLVTAKVVGKSINLIRNYLTLNVGSDDGVNINMPVISEKGLVGKVISVSDKYCIVEILKSKNFKASVIIERSRVPGILNWNGGENLIISEVAKNLDIRVGDIVKTSEYSSIFPDNIEVGTVVAVSYDTGNLFQKVEVKSYVDFSTIEETFVLLYKPDSSRVILEKLIYEKD